MVCFDPEEAPAITELARTLGYPDAHMVIGGTREAIQALHARTTSPDYIIIDIGQGGHDVLAELDELATHCEPSVRVALIGGVNDITLYRELKSRGIVEYYTRPVHASDVRAMLIHTPTHYAPGTPGSAPGKVISCMSAASGDGASTIAVNLAYCLAETYGRPTVLVDMDYQFGLIAKSLDVAAPFGIRELFDHPERGLDNVLVERMLVKYGNNLNIIASPSELRLLPMIRPEVIRELVGILRSKFKFVIIDVPHVWTDWTAAALSYSDHTVMVGQLWLRSLTHASRLLTAWQNVGIARDHVSLLINRSGAKFKEAITAEDFERICRHKIEAHVNNDVKAVVHAETHGKTLFEVDQTELLQKQIRQFAQGLVLRTQAEILPEGRPAAQGKKKLLTLFDKRNG
jgi:pilus assembly protein CpaE